MSKETFPAKELIKRMKTDLSKSMERLITTKRNLKSLSSTSKRKLDLIRFKVKTSKVMYLKFLTFEVNAIHLEGNSMVLGEIQRTKS